MRKILDFLVLLCLCVNMEVTHARESTVRVAFLPEMFGFYNIEENGTYSGYNYEYLMNLAQYTGWNYEFVMIEEGLVSKSLLKAEEMLEAGEIDLLGPYSVDSTHFDRFESGEKNYGVYCYNLYSARNKYAITRDNYFLQETLKVALVDGYTDLNRTFLSLMKESGIEVDVTYVRAHSETHELLFQEEVDTLLNLDMSSNVENLDYLTTIQRIPYYFVSTKGNTELIAELEEGIQKVEIAEPEIHQILLEKYFGTRYDGEFLLTEEESEYLATIETLKVGMLMDVPPYQYIDQQGNNVGITLDMLHIFEELIGVPIEIVWLPTHDDVVEASKSREVDIVATIPKDYTLADAFDVILTNPFISSSAYWLTSGNQVENPDIIKHFVSSNIPFYDYDAIDTTANIIKEFQRLNEEGTISIFCDPHITAYYTSLYQFDNIEVKAVNDVLSEITLGVGTHMDVTLVGILNRGILYTNSYLVDESIYKHTNVSPEYTFWDFVMDHALGINVAFLIVVGLIMISVLNTSKKFRELSRRDSLTKLYNAGYFHEYAKNKIPTLKSGALLLIDIDYFKDVNDHYGHQAGDEIIKLVAQNMSIIAKKSGFHSRVGGDEFAILIEESVDINQLQRETKAFLEAMAKNVTGISTTMSIGGFVISDTTNYENLYKNADKVLYKVKEQGRNGFFIVNHLEEIPEAKFTNMLTYDAFQEKTAQIVQHREEESTHAQLSIYLEGSDTIPSEVLLEFTDEVEKRLGSQVRRCDYICRKDGFHYLVFLESCGNLQQVKDCEKRIRTTLANSFHVASHVMNVNTRIELKMYPDCKN